MMSGYGTGPAKKWEPSSVPNGTASSAWLQTLSGKLWLVAFIFGALMFLCSLALDWVLLLDHERTIVTVMASDGLAGLVAGILVFRLLQFGRERRRLIEQRLVTISEMNHHIRNALQVISFSAQSSKTKEVAEITEAVDRIQWALREVLPKVEPTFEPFEGSARARFLRTEPDHQQKQND